MTDKQLSKLLNEAVDYPLMDRIAAKLVAEGYTEETYLEAVKKLAIPQYLVVNLWGRIRYIEHGSLEVDKRLKQLAEQL